MTARLPSSLRIVALLAGLALLGVLVGCGNEVATPDGAAVTAPSDEGASTDGAGAEGPDAAGAGGQGEAPGDATDTAGLPPIEIIEEDSPLGTERSVVIRTRDIDADEVTQELKETGTIQGVPRERDRTRSGSQTDTP